MKKIIIPIITLLILIAAIAPQAEAHVRYLIDEIAVEENSGPDYEFLLDALFDPVNIGMMLWTIAGVIIIGLIATQVKFFREKFKIVGERANGYTIFTPWMLRLSLGIALIGSGTAQTLISPVLEGFPLFGTVQILLGFLIMAGFLVVPAAIAALGIFIYGLTIDWYLFGNLDFAAIALSLIILNNEKPGIDDLLGISQISTIAPAKFLRHLTPIILRIGVGSAMIFLALYEKILNPHITELIVNNFGLATAIPVSPEMWVVSTGIIELIIGLAILFGLFTRVASAVAFVVLSLSFFYFGEEVSSHITLFGILAVLFITQGGAFSIDKKLFIRNPDFT